MTRSWRAVLLGCHGDRSVGLSTLGWLPQLWAQSYTVYSADWGLCGITWKWGSGWEPSGVARLLVDAAIYRTCLSTRSRLGKDPCNSYPSSDSLAGAQSSGWPASQMALLWCNLIFFFTYSLSSLIYPWLRHFRGYNFLQRKFVPTLQQYVSTWRTFIIFPSALIFL
jgi:hypothetical protein